MSLGDRQEHRRDWRGGQANKVSAPEDVRKGKGWGEALGRERSTLFSDNAGVAQACL